MPHIGYFWQYDKEAEAAVNAAGLELVPSKSVVVTQGGGFFTRSDAVNAPLITNQLGEGEILNCQKTGEVKFAVDKDGNIPLVGTVDGVDISVHAAAASAHHVRYADAEARAVHSPMSISPAAFVPRISTQDWLISGYYVENMTSLEEQSYYAPLILPNGVTVTRLTLHGYRDDALASMILELQRSDKAEGINTMASITAGWTEGFASNYDDTIEYPGIINESYNYFLFLRLHPNDNTADVRLTGVTIEFS